MAEPFLGEIRIVSFTYAPAGWALCNGQLLPINQNQALFALFGTTYGGNGQVNFALPDLRGRVAVHSDGSAFVQGQTGGQNANTLTLNELPTHVHAVTAVNAPATTNAPAGNCLAVANNLYAAPANLMPLVSGAVSSFGAASPASHENRQPFLALSFCVALQGVFPSQN